ncbi:putative toxin-antitoxin system toxin component, PIN family [Streptomyces sp. NPDC056061]|uniref:PIN domain-containing protein n=1 Tax=Streptomyces sp. NPDC056061 TaxID=3345700 RepID=UPI0035D8AF66
MVLDTCVLFPNYLRDTLLRLAEAELYEPLWSADILEELRRNLADKVAPETAKKVVGAMADAFPYSAVTGYTGLVPVMTNDTEDRHVLAAAVCGQAHAVVTLNLKDFPPAAADPYEVEVLHPDDVLLDMLDLAPVEVTGVLRNQAVRYRREPRDVHGLLDRLAVCGAQQFAAEFRRRL